MQDDIVTRLHRHRCVTGIRTVIDDAADEIERLRRNTGCARNQHSTQFCAEALDGQREVEKLRKELSEAHYDYRRLMTQMLRERDEARLLYCFRCSDDEAVARDMAKAMGWNCFKDIAGSSSTAPTPANTGGGAENQIPSSKSPSCCAAWDSRPGAASSTTALPVVPT